MKIILLRVGMDSGTDGMLSPIFPDNTFEFIPISEESHNSTILDYSYDTFPARYASSLADYLPERLKHKKLHNDPDFINLTYGDPTVKKKALRRLNNNDILAFYAGFSPVQPGASKGLYIIGFFTVDSIYETDTHPLKDRNSRWLYEMFPKAADCNQTRKQRGVLIVKGKRPSKLLTKALHISELCYSRTHKTKYYVLKEDLKKRFHLEGLCLIQRSLNPLIIDHPDGIANFKKFINY